MKKRPSESQLSWCEWLLAAAFGLMFAIAFANVLSRFLLRYSLAFTEELTLQLFVVVVVLGCALAFERGVQLGVEFFIKRLPHVYQRLAENVGKVLSTVLFLAVAAFLVRDIYFEVTLFRARSPSLNVPVWCYYTLVVLLTPRVLAGIWRTGTAKSSPPSDTSGRA